jgi:hypothetical protein
VLDAPAPAVDAKSRLVASVMFRSICREQRLVASR